MVLVGYWPLDEGSGSTAYDYSGKENDGTVNDGGDSTVPGSSGVLGQNAYSFDGNNDYVSIPQLSSNFSSQVSISGWLNPDTISGDNRQWVVEDGDAFMSYLGDNASHLYFRIIAGGSSTTFDTGYEMKLNQWQFIVLTYNGSKMQVYVDRELKGSKSKSGSLQSVDGISIGNDKFSGYDWYSGKIQEVRIYNHVLSPQEINYLYSVGKRGLHTSDKRSL